MIDYIKPNGNLHLDLTTDALQYYENYWTVSSNFSEKTVSYKSAIIELFFKDIPKGKRILEIGVGGEGGLIHLLKDNNNVYGIDASTSARINCEKLNLEIDVINLDTNRIPHKEDSFDIVFAFEVMEHFSNPQFVIEEIKRVLNNKGVFLLSTPNPLVHHWPRLFYPSLFEVNPFEEFLIANQFEIIRKVPLGSNHYFKLLHEDYLKAYSWGWFCKKMGDDPDVYLKHGLFFWEKKNAYEIRLKPIEAIDMFRKSLRLSEYSMIKARFFLTLSLLYRFNDGEKEFLEHYNYFVNMSKESEYPQNMISTFLLILVCLETRSPKTEEWPCREVFMNLMKYFSSFQHSNYFIALIKDSISKGNKIDSCQFLNVFDIFI